MSEQLLLLNPRRRRKRAKTARGRGGRFVRASNPRRKRRRKTVSRISAAPRRRRARRRNPIAAIAANPRRRRYVRASGAPHRRKRRANPRRRASAHRNWGRIRAHRRRVNPRLLPTSLSSLKATLIPAAIGGGGALALDVALAYVPVPAFLDNMWGKLAVKIVGAIGLGYAAAFVTSKENARKIAAGALTVVAYGAIRDGIKTFAPDLAAKIPGLSGITDYDLSDLRMGYVNPAPMLQGYNGGIGAYMDRANLSGMDAYMGPGPSTIDTVNQVNGYMNDGM